MSIITLFSGSFLARIYAFTLAYVYANGIIEYKMEYYHVLFGLVFWCVVYLFYSTFIRI